MGSGRLALPGSKRLVLALHILLVQATLGLVAVMLARKLDPNDVMFAYFWASLLAGGAYVLAFYLPYRQFIAALEKLEADLAQEEVDVSEALEWLRKGDLVQVAGPAANLPKRLREPVLNACASLAALLEEIVKRSVDVAAEGARIRETASRLEAGATEQAAGVVDITSAMEELATTAAHIAENAAAQADLAAEAEQSSEEGTKAVEAAVAGVVKLRETIKRIGAGIKELETKSSEIYRIVDLIANISSETHTLGLNASLEAARAGERGQRFSVVADEVKRLADRTRESAESVRRVLDEFRSALAVAVEASDEGVKEADLVADQATAAARSIERLRSMVERAAQAARQISAATEEQKSASGQVVETLTRISDQIQMESEGLKEVARRAEVLNGLALGIQLSAQFFRVDSPRSLKHRVIQWAAEVGDPAGQLQRVQGLLDQIVAVNKFIQLAYVVNGEGILLAYAVSPEVPAARLGSTVEVGRSYFERPWFQAATKERHCTVTPLYTSLLDGQKCFTVAAVLRDGEEIKGVLAVDVNARDWTTI